jgi:Mor family transcriptional regulator
VFQRAAALAPEKAEVWKRQVVAVKLPTAMEAYQQGVAFSFSAIQTLAARFGKEQILNDLYALTYMEFRDRYNVT